MLLNVSRQLLTIVGMAAFENWRRLTRRLELNTFRTATPEVLGRGFVRSGKCGKAPVRVPRALARRPTGCRVR